MILYEFKDAIIGVDHITNKIIYHKDIMIKILIDQGMDVYDAIDYLEFNVWNYNQEEYFHVFLQPKTYDELDEFY